MSREILKLNEGEAALIRLVRSGQYKEVKAYIDAGIIEKTEAVERFGDRCSAKKKNEFKDTTLITVCDKCFMACCWQGIFMCDKAAAAGTVDVSVKSLRYRNVEHEDYWEETRVRGT